MQLWLLLTLSGVIGLVAGLASGIFGIGGGSVRIPLLNLTGYSLIESFIINLFVIPFSSIIGAFSHRKNIDKKIGPYIMIGGAIGTIVGSLIAILLSVSKIVLATVFVITSIITVLGIYLKNIAPKFSKKLSPNVPTLIGGSFVINTIIGMRGGSGGSLFPPFLVAVNVDIKKAIANSLFATILTATVGIIFYLIEGKITNSAWIGGLMNLVGSLIGVRIGSLISLKSKPKWLEISLAVVIVIMALLTLVKALCW